MGEVGIVDVERRDEWIRVHFGPPVSNHADYHYLWLRHNCDGDRHPTTGERVVDSSEILPDVRPLLVRVDPDSRVLRIWWRDGEGSRESRYPSPWLVEHAYAQGREDVPPPPCDLAQIELGAARFSCPAELRQAAWERIERCGAVLVRGHDLGTKALMELWEEAGLRVVETHFGRIEDLRTDNTTNRNIDQLGYTDAAVQLHTDQPFLARPPRFQLLHCMRPGNQGGDSAVVDARQAALYLQSMDAEAFELLASVPVRFHRRQKEFEALHVGPVLAFRGEAEFQVRYSYFTMDPHRVPFNRMESWYRAYNRFSQLVRDPRHQYQFRLGASDFLMYDNFRMLHARTAFSGPRWVRGVYFSRDGQASQALAQGSSP
ncbi:MAG TPA: TauD/TfdA family dioxygenase [Myxococcota bacterium]|nr:TauD/TfdA family dioxygenase [Myxococcota bacterium]